jgi:hypothetical protein
LKKIKLYIDTSIISHLGADDAPERMRLTQRFWKFLQAKQYETAIGDLVLAELEDCPEPKRGVLLEKLSLIEYTIIATSREIEDLAEKYMCQKIFPVKYFDDALHIASASVGACQAILSWNFKHMVNLNTILIVNGVNKIEGYGEIEILTPESMIQEGDKND